MDKEQRIILKRVLSFLAGHGVLIGFSLLTAVISVVLTLYLPILTGQIIDCLIGEGSVDFAVITDILGKMALVIVLTAISQWVMNTCNNRIVYRVSGELRERAFCQIEQLPLSYLDAHPSGDMVSRVIADVDQFSDGLLMGFSQLFTGVVTILGTLVFMLSVSAPITAVVVVLTPISLLVANFIAKRTYTLFQSQSEVRGEQTALINEMITNQKVVQAYSQEEQALRQFDGINGRLQEISTRAVFFSSLTNPCTRFVNGLVYAAVALSGAFSVLGGSLSVGGLSAFLSYANQYTKPFNEISGVVAEMQNALACAGRLFELIDEKAQEPESETPSVLSPDPETVSLEHVCFSYSKDRKLIENFNLNVHRGERVAIVGPTGCGKTTMINLPMRFYDVDQGRIAVEDKDIRDLRRSDLRSAYGMVLQDTWLRSGTIRENIAMGRPSATLEEVIAAAKEAHAHGFIRRLPQGYDTVISENGGNLSQGQKQLLCIARVMLTLPPMLILDEATSSIDTRTEIQVQNAFAKLMQGRTSFVVAHRLSTIRSADCILVMRNGRIVEQGTHRELLAKNGFYRELCDSQFADEEMLSGSDNREILSGSDNRVVHSEKIE